MCKTTAPSTYLHYKHQSNELASGYYPEHTDEGQFGKDFFGPTGNRTQDLLMPLDGPIWETNFSKLFPVWGIPIVL